MTHTVTLPSGETVDFPDEMGDDAIAQTLKGYAGTQAAPQSAPANSSYMATPEQQPWSGGILPISTDAQGNVNFPDWNAGIAGGIKRLFQAAAAPGDVYSGKLQTPYSGSPSSEASPEVTSRALDFAMAFSPASAAMRSGEVIPGGAWNPPAVPTAKQLKNTAAAGYDAARASSVSVPGDAVANMAQQVQQTLQNDHGIIPKTAPKTYAILDELANPPKFTSTAGAAEIHPNPPGFDVHTNGPAGVLYADTREQAEALANKYSLGANDNTVVGTYPGLEAARRGLSGIGTEGGTEGYAAQKAIPELDKFIDSISPEAATARANYAAAMRSNALTGDLDRANTGMLEQAEARAHASNSGTNIDNSIRQRAASFLQNPQNLSGYSQAEIDSLNNLVQGGAVRNAARRVGNYLGGGGGLGSLAATAAGAALGGHLMPGIEGTALGAAVPTALGVSAKGLENALARRALAGVDETVRSRSPLAEAMQSQMVPAIGRSNALRLSAFAPTPQQTPPSLAQIMAQWYH